MHLASVGPLLLLTTHDQKQAAVISMGPASERQSPGHGSCVPKHRPSTPTALGSKRVWKQTLPLPCFEAERPASKSAHGKHRWESISSHFIILLTVRKLHEAVCDSNVSCQQKDFTAALVLHQALFYIQWYLSF